jgi:hypothetical protein
MYFVPSRYFMPGGRGGWLIDEENYKKLPDQVGRLIEEVESRTREVELPDGSVVRKSMFWVKFISKTAVAKLIAKHMLGTKLLIAPDQSWFDGLMKLPKESEAETVEAKMQQKLIPHTRNGAKK